MEAFNSKLQYQTCEAGEYYDEGIRNLNQTLELIDNFPWYKQQFAEVDVTGPSVTIRDAKGNYLKVGMYYGGRFCLYYLDHLNYYGECYPLAYNEVHSKVKEFFAGKLNLKKFEKFAFEGLWKRTYFTTHSLEYSVKTPKIVFINMLWLVFFLAPIFLYISYEPVLIGVPALLVLLAWGATFGTLFYYFFSKLYKYRGQHLHISRGNSAFTFGNTPAEIKEYDKKDIAEIRHYAPKNQIDPDRIEVFDILFKGGEQIRFTNALISYSALNEKFARYWKLDPIDVRQDVLAMI